MYNDFLSGRADELIASSLVDQILGRPKRGASVITTIDPVLQELAAQQLAGRAGAVVAMDPLTGEILAMVANPSFDPNPLALHDTKRVRAAWDQYLNDPDDPMISNANDEIHNPGSNFKMVTAAAALENGFGPESTWDNPDVLELPQTTAVITNAGGEPCPGGDQITLAVAFQYSCNTIFGEVGLELGPEALHEQAERFGFNTNTGLDVPSYAPGQFPPVESFQDQAPAVAYSAIGMRDVKANPLQMAMVAAAIANDGTLMVPHFMREIRDPQGLVVKRYDPHVFGQSVSSQTAAALTQMMIAAVESGTGTAAQVPGYQVAGKTGTAQLDPDLPPHVWFTGFAPADDPAIVVSVMLLDGGGAGVDATGGRVAAPIAQAILAEYLSRAAG
jgi:peptidoglycan glycosyltransferase